MKSIESLIIIAIAILIGIALLVGIICLIITLVQIKKTVKEFGNTIRKVNIELDLINKASTKVASISGKFSSLLTSAVSVLFYALSKIIKSRGGKNERQ